MEVAPDMTLNERLIMKQIAAIEHRPDQVQSAISSSTGLHERLVNAFYCGVLFDLFLCSSDVRSSKPSNVRILLGTELNKTRYMTHTPAGGIDEEKDMISLVGRLTISPHSRRSAVTPISLLPPELLVQIFRLYALEVPPWSRVSTHRGIKRRGWIAVTRVCRRWRQAALGDSLLWARITGFSSSPKWIAEMLVRSRNAPLIVDLPATPVPGTLSKFTLHIFRIRELRLRDLSLLNPPGLRDICALEAPALEHLELGVSTPYPVTFHQLGGTTLFGGRAPKLRTLFLSKVSIPWSLIPRGLTQLKINLFREIPSPDTPSPNESDQLLDLLINSPDLEVLVLGFCLPTILSQAPDGWAIHLPRLSRLCLGGSTSHVANLLRVLLLPSSTTLRLRCIPNSSTNDVKTMLPLASAHFHNHAPMVFRSLRVTLNSLNSPINRFNDMTGPINVAASTVHPKSTISGLHALEDEMDNDAELTMSFDGLPPLCRSTQGIIVESVFSMLPISNIEFLSISVPVFVRFVNWYELSQRCENVTTIRASGPGTSGLLQSLAPLEPTETTSGGKGEKGRCVNKAAQAQGGTDTAGGNAPLTPFPKLTFLLLEDLDFNLNMDQYDALYDAIAYVLRWRWENNTPLNMLGIDHCIITPDRVKGLEKYVQELRWDGDEGDPNWWMTR